MERLIAKGRMILNVSKVNGTLGIRKAGSELGSAPRSPTLRTSIPVNTATSESAMMQTSGEGMAFVKRGRI